MQVQLSSGRMNGLVVLARVPHVLSSSPATAADTGLVVCHDHARVDDA